LGGKGEDEARFRAQVIEDIVNLTPEAIIEFYVGSDPAPINTGTRSGY
jgi:hypothetical protein